MGEVVLAVAVVSMGEVSVVESAAAEVESALVEHTSQGAVGTLPAEDPGFLHLCILHLGSPSMMDGVMDRPGRPLAQEQPLIGRRILLGNGRRWRLIGPSLQRRGHLEQLHYAD
jgi:hypothetical protein